MIFGFLLPLEKFFNASWRTISGLSVFLLCKTIVYTYGLQISGMLLRLYLYSTFRVPYTVPCIYPM